MRCVAIIGGLQPPKNLEVDGEVRHYRSPRDGSWRDAKRAVKAIKAGSFDEVILWTRFNSHVVTKQITKACKDHGVPVSKYGGT